MKKRLKSLLASCLVISLMCPSITAFAAPEANSEMDNLDVLIAAHYFLASDNGESFWPDSLSDTEIVPLYNIEGQITSYYVELNGGGYAVVNNNAENPTIIEFGADNNPLIRDILNQNSDPHIIYNNPLSLYDANNAVTIKNGEEQSDLYENYPDLLETDVEIRLPQSHWL